MKHSHDAVSPPPPQAEPGGQDDHPTACELTAQEALWTYRLLAPGAAGTGLDAVLARPHLDLGALHGKC